MNYKVFGPYEIPRMYGESKRRINKEDIDIFTEVVARSLTAAGARQGMKLHNSRSSESFCHICVADILNRKPPSSKMNSRKSSNLELVYSDVRG